MKYPDAYGCFTKTDHEFFFAGLHFPEMFFVNQTYGHTVFADQYSLFLFPKPQKKNVHKNKIEVVR